MIKSIHTMQQHTVESIRRRFLELYRDEEFVVDKTGVKLLEITGASFVADEDTIFGKVDRDYVDREIAWYESQSLSVADIPGKTPKIWNDVADDDGLIHSNYGFLIWSATNDNQFENCVAELRAHPSSRRAMMIYTRPQIQQEFCLNGMSDFICTNAVQYLIRDRKLEVVVQMRSNDVVFGFRNDLAWQKYVADEVVEALGPEFVDGVRTITWQVGSLHVYERHFNLLEKEIAHQNSIAYSAEQADKILS